MAAGLSALGCRVETSTRTALRVVPPTFRPDLRSEVDLVEEVARTYSFDRIPASLPSAGRAGGLTREQQLRRLARRVLLGSGLSEAQTLSMLPPWLPDRLGLPGDHPWRDTLAIANPLSEEESVLRRSLVPGLLLAAARNVARRNTTVMLFETGTAFEPSGEELPREPLRAAWLLTGPAPTSWHRPHRDFDFFDAKGIAERLVDALGVEGLTFDDAPGEPWHPGRAASVRLAGITIGTVAELAPRAARALDLGGRVAVAEIDLAPILAAGRTAAPGELPRFPAVVRDLALLVPAATPASEAERAIRAAGGPTLARLAIFDVYPGDQVGSPGHVSLAFSLEFRHPDRTLTDAEVGEVMRGIDAAAGAAGWTIR
jgi:phenylalanyl-tRNA synthetase beta chain